jgi:hypothetical protein
MADNDKSKIRYDDFIGNVQPDPAKPESTIMLSGFVGHGPEGHARIYPDPTLGTWYDVPEDDVVYSTPIADSKLGGSYVWVRASSEIKPGSAAAPATEAAAEPQQAAAVGMNPTPRTHCFVCDPPKVAAGIALQPTPATHCFICPPHTLPCSLLCQADPRGGAAPAAMGLPHTAATVCTQFGCPPQGPVGGQVGTFSIWCSLLCGTTKACAEAAAPAAMALPHTAATVCTQFGCAPNAMPPTLWCTWVGCPPGPPNQFGNMAQTAVTVCVTDCQPPGNAMMRAAVGMNPMNPTPATHCFVCDPPMAAFRTNIGDCPQLTPHLSAQTLCTQHCPQPPPVVHLTVTLVPSVLCTYPDVACIQFPHQPQAMMAAQAHPTPSAVNQCGGPAQPTLATVCTQPPACPPHTVHNSMCVCPTPSAVHQCGGQTFTPTIPQFTVFGACPTFGVCPSMACTPMTPIQNGVFTPFGR